MLPAGAIKSRKDDLPARYMEVLERAEESCADRADGKARSSDTLLSGACSRSMLFVIDVCA